MNQQFYTIDEVVSFLKVSKMTVYRWIKAGKLPAYRIGRDYRIDVADYAQLLINFKLSDREEDKEVER